MKLATLFSVAIILVIAIQPSDCLSKGYNSDIAELQALRLKMDEIHDIHVTPGLLEAVASLGKDDYVMTETLDGVITYDVYIDGVLARKHILDGTGPIRDTYYTGGLITEIVDYMYSGEKHTTIT